jgi:hypothetical protein
VALGAAVAPQLHFDRLLATLGAFFLGVGVCAHVLDELHGRPLGTQLSNRALVALGVAGFVGAVGIGVAGLFIVSPTLAPFVVIGAFVVVAYNLELFGGRLHNDFWFATFWGGFPAFTSYWANALSVDMAGILVVLACVALSAAQRRLSTPVRQLRRRTIALTGRQTLSDGDVIELSSETIAGPLDGALRVLSIAVVLLATGFVIARL